MKDSPVARIAVIAVVALLIVGGATIGVALILKNTNSASASHNSAGNVNVPVSALAANANGTAGFFDGAGGAGRSDAVKIAINGLLAVPAGDHYEAWLVNSANNQAVALGTLAAQGQVYALNYAGNGTNLLGEGNTLEITLEHGEVSTPTGKVLLTASFPAHAFSYLQHLLVSYSSTPQHSGLLVGLYSQAQALDSVAQQLTAFAAQPNTPALQCTLQSMLDIVEGKSGAHYKPLPANCAGVQLTNAGDGFGLLGKGGYVAQAQAQVELLGSQSDATLNMQVHERHVGYALTDMQAWLTTLDQDAARLLSNPSSPTGAQDIVTLADQDLYGLNNPSKGANNYAPGQAGATVAYIHGQYMAALVLAPAS